MLERAGDNGLSSHDCNGSLAWEVPTLKAEMKEMNLVKPSGFDGPRGINNSRLKYNLNIFGGLGNLSLTKIGQ